MRKMNKSKWHQFTHHTLWCVCTYLCLCECMYISLCEGLFNLCVSACMSLNVYVCVCVYVHVCECVCVCICTCMWMCVCVCVCAWVYLLCVRNIYLSACAYIYIYIYLYFWLDKLIKQKKSVNGYVPEIGLMEENIVIFSCDLMSDSFFYQIIQGCIRWLHDPHLLEAWIRTK